MTLTEALIMKFDSYELHFEKWMQNCCGIRLEVKADVSENEVVSSGLVIFEQI